MAMAAVACGKPIVVAIMSAMAQAMTKPMTVSDSVADTVSDSVADNVSDSVADTVADSKTDNVSDSVSVGIVGVRLAFLLRRRDGQKQQHDLGTIRKINFFSFTSKSISRTRKRQT